MKLFIANVAFNLTEADLKQMFSQFGQVASIKLMTDPETGKRKGFGFIEMPIRDQALSAIAGLHDKIVNGRKLSLKEAVDKGQSATFAKPTGGANWKKTTNTDEEIDRNRW